MAHHIASDDIRGSTTMNTETTAFPTFLDTDPFPSTTPDGRPLSSGSATTDATSEFAGDDYRSAKERQSNIPSLTGPVGEPGLPPSRPISQGQSNTRRGLQARVVSPKGGLRSGLGDGNGSRPTTAMSPTHIPTLVAPGFSNPMSSQMLQAQRGQRAGVSGLSRGQTPEVAERPTQSRHRYSNASVNTLRDGHPSVRDEDVPPLPPSRGTDGAQDFNVAASVTSGTSTTPLNHKSSAVNNLRLQSGGLPTPTLPTTPRSPRSFRASLGLNSRTHSWARDRRTEQHQQLPSNPSSPAHDAEKPRIEPQRIPQKDAGRNYEYYAGNMLFFLSGRCMNTKARPLNMVTFTLTTLPCALFFAFSAPWLWHNISPALPIIFAYLYFLTISSFFHAAFSDPGTLPRNLHPHPANPDEDRDPLTVGPPTTEWVMIKTFPGSRQHAASPETPPVSGTATAMEVPTKYCKSCTIWRPPRAHHCRICDACIETQDHHCVWLNNCVGRRNYRFFFGYVLFASVLDILLLILSVLHVRNYGTQHGISFGASLSGRTQERVAFAMFIYSIIALPYPGSLLTYHIFLIARGESTREYLNSHKFLKKDRHRPFSQSSWIRNWIAVLLRPRTPTYMQFKKRYSPGDLRLGHTAPQKTRKKDLREKYTVEMEKLPPKSGSPKQNASNGAQSNTTGSFVPRVQQQQQSQRGANGLSGPVNNTPR